MSRRKPIVANRVAQEIECGSKPAYGQVRVSNELKKKGIFVSASGVRPIWVGQAHV